MGLMLLLFPTVCVLVTFTPVPSKHFTTVLEIPTTLYNQTNTLIKDVSNLVSSHRLAFGSFCLTMTKSLLKQFVNMLSLSTALFHMPGDAYCSSDCLREKRWPPIV